MQCVGLGAATQGHTTPRPSHIHAHRSIQGIAKERKLNRAFRHAVGHQIGIPRNHQSTGIHIVHDISNATNPKPHGDVSLHPPLSRHAQDRGARLNHKGVTCIHEHLFRQHVNVFARPHI